MSRGFGVLDEPSIRDQCNGDYAGFRLFRHAADRPLALVRVEKTDKTSEVVTRTFEHSGAGDTKRIKISHTQWAELVELLEQSGFWTLEMDDTHWTPDSAKVWIEACVDNRFRSISVYTEQSILSVYVADFLSELTPEANQKQLVLPNCGRPRDSKWNSR